MSKTHLRLPALCLIALPVSALLAAFAAPAQSGTQVQVAATLDDFFLPGTQPGDLTDLIQDSNNCVTCHGNYDPIVEPYEPWAASMMGQAGRDPIFYATLTIANQDVDFGGDACLRCHAPSAWLQGRSTPTDGSALDPSQGDLDGVTCHFCHRMVDPVPDPANPADDTSILAALTSPAIQDPHTGSFVLDPLDVRRGPFDLGTNFFFHMWRESPFHRESLMCATCHDVSNPLLERQTDGSWQLGPLGTPHPSADKDDQFPVERTFSEWASSVYAQDEIDTQGRFGGDRPTVSSCQDCHMPDNEGTGCNPGFSPPTRPDVPEHSFSGANTWVLRAIRSQYPDFETGLTQQSVDTAIARNEAMLASAADLEVVTDGGQLRVRVTNMMGHKLPTGYGEGRRMWIGVRYFDASDALISRDGGYDNLAADLDTATTTVYEIDHGIDTQMSAATGLPTGKSLHFLLNNTIEKDNRIPARGFRNSVYDAIGAPVVGAAYSDAQYWSETNYAIPAGAVRAEVRLFHQTTSKEYIEFLRDENVTDTRGTEAYQLWDMFGRSAPVEMGLVDHTIAQSAELAPRPLSLGKPTAGGRPEITLTGSTLVGGTATIQVTGAQPGALAVLFRSPGQGTSDSFGGEVNLSVGARRIATLNLDSNGEAQIPLATFGPQDMGGATYQLLFRDTTDTFGIGMTGGLRVDVTN